MSRMNSNSNNDEIFDYLFKIVVVGDCGIGKTSLVQRFKSGLFTDRYTNTIGVDFAMKTVLIEGKRIKVSNQHKNQDHNQFHESCVSIVLASNMGHCWTGKISNNHSELLQICQRSSSW